MTDNLTPVEKVLDRLRGIRKQNGYFMALCPAHDDRDPSLKVEEADDGRALIKCFADCPTEGVVEALGLSMKDLFASEARGGGGPSYPSKKRKYVNTPDGCTLEAYSVTKGLPVEFLESLGVSEIPNYNGSPAVRFPYGDAEGEEVCIRFRVSLDGDPKIKTRRGDKHTLYGLWRLTEYSEGYVVVVEGESDAQTLWYHDVPAVGVPGASSWRHEWSEHLEAFDKVYVIVEPDQGGEQLWEKMTASPASLSEKLYRVTLDGFKDASAMHLDDPERVGERILAPLAEAESFVAISRTEAEERSREAWGLCEGLAKEDRILDRLSEDIKRCGLAGETKAAKLIYLAVNSRHLNAKQLVNIAVKGPSSAGKSFTVEKVLEFYPEEAFHFLTAMSERALAYSEEPLARRFLILAEAAGMSGEFATYLIRSLLSEGRLRYETVDKTAGGLKPRIIEREGPTGLVVTTTRTRLHSENETRMLTVVVNDSREHTSEILATLADEDHESPDMEPWRALQVWIAGEDAGVTIPYSRTLADLVPPVAVRLRRDFGSVLNLIRSHALLHRATRERDDRGRVVATIEDYAVVRDLISELISEGAEATVSTVVRETVEAVTKLLDGSGGTSVNIRQVGAELHLEYQPTYRRVKMASDAGYLDNLEDRKGKPAKLVVGDPMPEDVEILPTPERLVDTTRVINIDTNEPYDVYIGRGKRGTSLKKSKWHNPYVVDKDGTRDECVAWFERDFRADLLEAKPKDLPEIAGKVLGCHCAPKACHGHVLVKLVKDYVQEF